jgi:2-iminoacetate synthase ThiH
MQFSPEKYAVEDKPMTPFIDAKEIWDYLNKTTPSADQVREIIAKSLEKKRLTLAETAVLVNASDPDLIDEIKQGALQLKEKIYGKRIVLFAPLYVGNKCTNNCIYCGFRTGNAEAVRKTLSNKELIREVETLEDAGQKRLILVYGEHPDYSADFIFQTVRTVYETQKGKGKIRRVNINAAPLEIDGGTKIEIGAYAESLNEKQNLNREQFFIHDSRSLDDVIDELLDQDFIPSFCTACYRLGRTGEHFMEISVPGFIHNFCTPNAILTLTEYLVDYASEKVKEKGWQVIKRMINEIGDDVLATNVKTRISKILNGERDLYF